MKSLAGYIKTTTETYYSNDMSEAVIVNVFIANTHTAAVNVTLSVSSLTQGLSRGSGVPIFKGDLDAGEVLTYKDIVLNAKQNIMAVTNTADKATIKVDVL